MLASILKGTDPKLAALQGPIKVEAAKQQLNSFDNPIKRLVFAYNSNDLPVANKQEVMDEFFANPLAKEAVEHIIFNSNVTDLDARKAAINYTKVGGSELLKLIKEKATSAQKEILLGTIENYSKNHLVDQFINSNSLPERKKVLNFINATTFDKFIEAMNEIVDQDIDVEKTNDLFKAKNLITADRKLTEIEIKALVKNFSYKALNDIANVIDDKTGGELRDIIANKRLVGLPLTGMVIPLPKPIDADYVQAHEHDGIGGRKHIFNAGEKIKNQSEEAREGKVIDTEISNKAGQVYYALHAGRNTVSNNMKAKTASLEKDLKDVIRILLSEELVIGDHGLNDKEVANKVLELLTKDEAAVKVKANQILADLKANLHIQKIIGGIAVFSTDENIIDKVFTEDKENVYTLFNNKLDKKHPVTQDQLVEVNIPTFLPSELQKIKLEEIQKLPGAEFEYKINGEILVNNIGKVYYAMQAEKSKKPEDMQTKLIGAVNDLSNTIRIILTEDYILDNPAASVTEILELFTENSKDQAGLTEKAKEVLTLLKVNPHVKKVIGKNKDLDDGKVAEFINNLFTEDREQAIARFDYKFDQVNPADATRIININIPQVVKDNIKYEKDREFKTLELTGIKESAKRIEYAADNHTYLDTKNVAGHVIEKALNQELTSIINDFDKVAIQDKADLLVDPKAVNHIKSGKIAIGNELNDKLNNWANDNIVEILIKSNLNKDLKPDSVKKLATKANYELVQNYFEEIADAKNQVLKLAELNNGKLPSTIASEHIPENIADSVNSLLPAGAKKLNKAEIATILNKTSSTKINPILTEIAKNKVPPAGKIYTANDIKTILTGISGSAPRFLEIIDDLGATEKAMPKPGTDKKKDAIIKATSEVGKKYQQFVDTLPSGVRQQVEGTQYLYETVQKVLITKEIEVNPGRYNSIEGIRDLMLAAREVTSGITINKKLVGPLTEKEHQHIDNVNRLEATYGEIFNRMKINYEALVVDLAYDKGFLQHYQKYDNKNAKKFQAISDPLTPELGMTDFINFVETAAEKENLERARLAADPIGEILSDAAYMFNLEEINGPVERRRLARQAERAEIRNRLKEEATNEVAGVELMFEMAEREAEAKAAAERERLEDVATDAVFEGIAGLFAGDEVAAVPAESVVEAPVERGDALVGAVPAEPVVEAPEAPIEEREGAPAEEDALVGGEAPREEAAVVTAPAPVVSTSIPAEDKTKLEIEKKAKASELAKEEAMKIAAREEEAKRAEEVRIAEVAQIEAEEVTTMQTAVKEDKKMIGAIYNPIHDITQMSRNILSNRMIQTTLSNAAVAAGDEDERVLDKGVWLAGIYGTNKQGSQGGFSGYKGHASGGTIGFDIGFDNFKDVVGVAYTKLDSKFKSNGSRLNTNIDSHIVALYGQKELPKNFMIQGMFAYNHNIVKSKINRLGTIATGKYKNDNYNFETLLSYNHLMSGGITLTPNLGVRYGHSKDGLYQESDVGIQHLSIASKKQNLWSGILGGSVTLAPQKIAESFSITPALQASVENYFNDKSKKLNAKVKWKDREVNETVALPKQPKVGYNIGASILTEKGNVSVLLEYNCHLQKKYQSHQGFVKLKVKL